MQQLLQFFQGLDPNALLIGILSLISTFGFKYIYDDLDDYIEEILDSEFMRKVYIFAFVYLATRDWKISLLIWLVYLVFIWCCVDKTKQKKKSPKNNQSNGDHKGCCD